MDTSIHKLFRSVSEAFDSLVSAKTVSTVVTVALIVAVGFALVRLLLNATRRISRKGLPARSAMILENLLKYGGYTVILLTATKRAGIDISALLGAAGIAGIALGFAAQTSVANIISGLFLFSEHIFKIGDVLQIDAVTGVVESVELMSIRIRTFDNRLVRVPNETLIKTNIVNVSHYPERRLDLWLTLPNASDFTAARTVILEAIGSSRYALSEPEPLVLLDAVTPDGTTLLAGVWYRKENLTAIKNELIPAILGSLAKIGIIPQAKRIEVSGIQSIES